MIYMHSLGRKVYWCQCICKLMDLQIKFTFLKSHICSFLTCLEERMRWITGMA